MDICICGLCFLEQCINITVTCVLMCGITVRRPRTEHHKEVCGRQFTQGGCVGRPCTLEQTGVFFLSLYTCITSDRYDWNVFNFVRTKWSSGTTWLVVSWFRTEQTSAAPAAKSGTLGGADATTARGWRACSTKTRGYEWTFLSTARASRYKLSYFGCLCVVIFK